MATVRPAVPGDAAAICRVCGRAWRDAYDDLLPERYVEANVSTWYRPERIERRVQAGEGRGPWLVAVDDGSVAGVAQWTVEGDCGEVLVLYVDPGAQGRGHGSRLLNAVTGRQRDRGAAEQAVAVFEGNEPGIGFYREHGFERAGVHPSETVDGVDPDHRTVRLRRPL